MWVCWMVVRRRLVGVWRRVLRGSWSARIAAQEGSAFYEGLGARTLLQVTPGRGHTGYPIASLVGADLAAATRLGFL